MSKEMTDRIVAALVGEGLLAGGSAEAARRTVGATLEGAGADRSGGMSKLVEVVAYLGGALVLAAGLLFVAQQWDDLGEGGRTIALLVVTVVLAVAGLVARADAGTLSPARRRLAGTLLTGAAVAAGLATGQAIEAAADLDHLDVYWPAVAGGLVVLLGAIGCHLLVRTPLALIAMLGGAVTAVTALVSAVNRHEGLWFGGSLFVLAVVWLLVVEAGVLEERPVGRALGVALALFGAQFCLADDHPWVAYLLTLVVVVAGVMVYLAVLDWTYLAVAVVGVTLLVPEVVSDWAGDSLGVVGGVLVAGVTLLAASFAGYRLREETTG